MPPIVRRRAKTGKRFWFLPPSRLPACYAALVESGGLSLAEQLTRPHPLTLPFEHVQVALNIPSGRPMTADAAWRVIREEPATWILDADEGDVRRRKLRARAEFRRYFAHRSVIPMVRESPLVVLSGRDAAAHFGLPVDPEPDRVVDYVAAADCGSLPPMTDAEAGMTWNVQLGVIADPGWPSGRSARPVRRREDGVAGPRR